MSVTLGGAQRWNPAWGRRGRLLVPSQGQIVAAHLDDGNTATNATTVVTNSVTPGANRLVLLLVDVTRNDSTNPAIPSGVAGAGLTWVLVDSSQYDTAGIGRRSGFLYRALGTPSTGAITVTLGYTADKATWCLDHFAGVDQTGTNGSGAIVQEVKATGTNNAPAATLAAFGSARNGTYGGVAGGATNGAEVHTAGSGFTILGQKGALGNQATHVMSEYQGANDTSVDAAVTSGANGWAIFAVEIKAA